MTTAAEFIAAFERFSARTYFDVNAYRLGYGSDTEGPDEVHVTDGMTTTKERALANLALRIKKFAHIAIYGAEEYVGMGEENWNALNENQRTAILSIVYNYGHLPGRVIIFPTDPEKTAASIRTLQNDNAGINRGRRLKEAAFYLIPPDMTAPPPAPVPQVPWVPIPARLPAPPASIPASTAGQVASALNQLIAYQTEFRAKTPTPFDEAIASLEKLGSAPPLSLPSLDPAAITKGKTKMFGANWITTMFGTGSIGSAVVTIGIDVINKRWPDPATMSILMGLISAGLVGINAKDKNVTGGSVPQTSEAKARATSAPIA